LPDDALWEKEKTIPWEDLYVMENAVRMPRDKPKPSREEPKKPRRTEQQRRERMAKARHDYDAGKRAERRANVIRFVETYHIGEGDADFHDVPYVQDWMFPITVEGNSVTKGGIRRERFTIRSKREFLERFKPWVVPGVHAERKESLADDTRRARGPRHKRTDYYDEDFSVYAQLSGTHGEWTNEDDVVYNELLEEVLRSTEATRTEARLAADYLIDLTPGPMLLQFMNSPTGLVEAILFYAEVTPNLLVLQVVSSQMRNGTVREQVLNGSRGSWTDTDDVPTVAQHQILSLRGIEEVIFAAPGVIGYYLGATFLPPANLHVYEPTGAWYSSTSRFVCGGISGTADVTTVDALYDDMIALSAGATVRITCPQLGMMLEYEGTTTVVATAICNQEVFLTGLPGVDTGLEFFGRPTRQVLRKRSSGETHCTPAEKAAQPIVRDGPKEVKMPVLTDEGDFVSVAFLNGANGEATNKDDVRRVKGKRSKAPPRRKQAARAPTRTRRRRSAARQSVQHFGVGLSPCASKYAVAVANPFHPDSEGACIPTFPSPDSQKVMCMQRTVTITIGTMGIGGAFIAPSVANDAPNIACTTAQYSATTLFMPGTEVAGDFSLSYPASLPYQYSELQVTAGKSMVQSRMVSAGYRVRYTGTQLNMGGMVSGFIMPNHHSVAYDTSTGPLTWTHGDVTTRPFAVSRMVDRRMNAQWQTASVNAHETTFREFSYPYIDEDNAGTTGSDPYASVRNCAIGVIVVTGEPGNTFNLEVCTHVEYIGQPCNSALTRTHTDARGFELVQQAAGQLARSEASSNGNAWSMMKRLLSHAASELMPVAMNGISLVAQGVAGRQRRALGFH
jgi:hypothetical protein